MRKNLARAIVLGLVTASVCGVVLPSITIAANLAPTDKDIIAGQGARIDAYLGAQGQPGGIAIGENAYVENMSGWQEYYLNFGQTTFSGFFSKTADDPSKLMGSIAIGQNTYARSGSTIIGNRNYEGALGDVSIDLSNVRNYGLNVDATVLGSNSFGAGALSSVVGAYSIASSSYKGGFGSDATKNLGATIYGSLNSIESATSGSNYSGVASSVIGFANKSQNANGALIWGSGNEITNSIETISVSINNAKSADEAQEKAIGDLQTTKYAGGSVLAIGGGNKADWAKYSQVMGVQNQLLGDSQTVSLYNFIDGYKNTATKVQHVTVIGSYNTVEAEADNNIVVGDNHTIAEKQTNNIILGSMDEVTAHTASDAVVIGHNAQVQISGGVALGSGAIANTSAGIYGYDPKLKAQSQSEDMAWKSTAAAVSVGDVANGVTRQITGVAAGTADTDAVNVAQLKQAVSDISITTIENNINQSTTNLVVDGEKSPIVSIKNDGHESTIAIGNNEKAAVIKEIYVEDAGNAATLKVGNDGSLAELSSSASGNEHTFTLGKQQAVIKDVVASKPDEHTISVKVGDGEAVTLTDTNTGRDTVNSISGAKNADGSITITQTTREDTIENGVWTKGEERTSSIEGIASKDFVDREINKLGTRVDKVGAGAVALAALHPMDFDPDDKLTFAAGVGNYRGETAAAVGAFYRPDEKVMFSIGGTMGNGENMVNAGVSFALDRVSHVNNSKVAMAKEIIELRAQVAQLASMVQQMVAANGMQPVNNSIIFPDVPENHWAYEYINALAARGIIDGYPDGTFGGDRTMTRYEYATVLYRALAKGEQLDTRIAAEFAPELSRIRVERIAGKDVDADKIERVRVNKNKTSDNYGSKVK